MIYNVIVAIVCVVILTALAIAGGGMPKSWVQFTLMIVCFGIANAIRTSRRHSAKGAPESKPLISTPAISTPRSPVEITATTKTAREAKGSNAAGELVQDKLMITDLELQKIVQNHTDYSNVFRFAMPPTVGNVNTSENWYLVVSPTSGVFFNRNGSKIWSVNPSGLTIHRHPISDIVTGLDVRSVDGREEKVQFESTSSIACVLAWTCDSYEKFKAEAQKPFLVWGLLAFELETGHSPSAFLRWQPPYGNLSEGIERLSEDPVALKAFPRAVASSRKVVLARMKESGFPENNPVYVAIETAHRRGQRMNIVALAIFGLIIPNAFLIGWWQDGGGIIALIATIAFSSGCLWLLLWGLRKYPSKNHPPVSTPRMPPSP